MSNEGMSFQTSSFSANTYIEILEMIDNLWIMRMFYMFQQDYTPSHAHHNMAHVTQEWLAKNFYHHVTPPDTKLMLLALLI